jgi:exosortase
LVLVPFVTLALVYRNRSEIFTCMYGEFRTAAVVVLCGAALIIFARSQGSLEPGGLMSIAMAGIVLVSLGGFLACYGRQTFQRALFPLLFLAFAVPIPDVVLDAAVAVLKRGSTEAAAMLFSVTGTAFHRDGYVFTLRDFVIEVADECSGIRSSIALLLTTLLAGHMFLRTGWKKAILVAAILPLTVFKNGIRIVTLSLLAMHVDPGFLTGQLHHEGGIVFFLLALAILFPLFVLLGRSEANVSSGERQADHHLSQSPSRTTF